MKKHLTWFLFLGYFGIFVVIGLIFYFGYLDSYLSSNASSIELETTSKANIYFSQNNSLFRVNPNFLTAGATIDSSQRLQSTGLSESLSVSADGTKISFSSISKLNLSEVRLVNLDSNQADIIQPTAAGFSSFSDPKFSPDSAKLAFLASGPSSDTIFLKDLQSEVVTNLTRENSTKIADYSFNQAGTKLVYCSQGATENSCQIIDLLSLKVMGTFKANASQIFWDRTALIYFLSTDEAANIFACSEQGVSSPITAVSSPKKITQFDLDSKGTTLAYEIKDGANTDIYTSKIDGSNIVQLTTDQVSFQPVISPDGKQVAYLKSDGVYKISTEDKTIAKLLNLSSPIDHLLAWR